MNASVNAAQASAHFANQVMLGALIAALIVGLAAVVWIQRVLMFGLRSVAGLADEVAKGLRQSDVLDIFEKQGLQSAAGRPEELAALVAGEVTKWAKVIKTAGITPG